MPTLAGYLVIDLLDEDDELHWVVAVHADPEKTELVRELRGQYPPTLSTHPIQVALRTGEPQLLPDLQAEADAMAHDTRHARAIRKIANTSGLVAPLVARGRTLGTISLGTIEGQPRFDESDLAMAMELARRISLALDNARLFAEAQERAHAAVALEYVDDGVILVDEAGIVRLWNPTAAISLRRPAVEAVGRPIAELLGDWQSLRSRIPIASEPQAGASRAQTLPVEVQGEERWLSISAVRFPGGTVYAFRDVTDERAVEQMKTDFVSTVSHELRTPLAAIYGAAMTLRRRDVAVEESQRDKLLEVVSNEADRLARIVNDILWASRLESGRMSIAIERCDAAAIATEVVDVLRSRAPEGIDVAVRKSRGLPQVAADPDKLRQILTNLIDNAIKYSPDGGPRRGRDRPQRRSRPVPRDRRGARHPARGAGPDLREVLPPRPEPDARRRRHGSRPLHLARARDADERPHLGRLRRPQRLVVLPGVADRLTGPGGTCWVSDTGRVRFGRVRLPGQRTGRLRVGRFEVRAAALSSRLRNGCVGAPSSRSWGLH